MYSETYVHMFLVSNFPGHQEMACHTVKHIDTHTSETPGNLGSMLWHNKPEFLYRYHCGLLTSLNLTFLSYQLVWSNFDRQKRTMACILDKPPQVWQGTGKSVKSRTPASATYWECLKAYFTHAFSIFYWTCHSVRIDFSSACWCLCICNYLF